MPFTKIRYYNPDEIEEKLQQFSVDLTRVANMTEEQRKAYANKLAQNAYVFGIEQQGVCTGLVAFYANDPNHHTAYCSLLVGHTRGTVLLVHMEEYVKELGFHEIQLEVSKENTRANNFYEKHNYRKMELETEESIYRSKKL